MNNVLLVGNGFDLAHGLLTKYEHFLDLMKNWDEFYSAFIKEKQKKEETRQREKEEAAYFIKEVFGEILFEKPIDKYIKNVANMDKVLIDKLDDIIKNNSWVNYYSHCEAEIDGWIDFEKEIYPVIELFDFIFNYNYELEYERDGTSYVAIPLKSFNAKNLKTAELWNNYIDIGPQKVYLNNSFVTNSYGILKKKILKKLRDEFDDFIHAFEIYLHEFVYKNDDVKPLEQIMELKINSVISFNYTLTERLYGVAEDDVHHLHGIAREDLSGKGNNMVMGVNESAEQNMDFIYFVKYFQRIQKSSGTRYKKILKKETKDERNIRNTDYNLYIYGHSLDETDEDIITYAIGKRERLAQQGMKPRHVTIFYYDAADYEQKVINLIKLYGRDIVEIYMERNNFEFVQTSS